MCVRALRGALELWLGCGAKPPSSRTRARRDPAAGWLKDDVVELEAEIVDGFLDEVAVAIADVLELRRGDAHEEVFASDVGEARGFEPGLERLPVDLFFERAEDAYPVIQHGGRCRNK